jgi:hypothetical protein
MPSMEGVLKAQDRVRVNEASTSSQ